jgi:hypothetical protein
MGIPTPLSLIAARSPAPSTQMRHEWKIRGGKVQDTHITTMGPLTLLTRVATAEDLWTCEAGDEVVAAQLFWLDSTPPTNPREETCNRQRLLEQWRASYPWATRYTS